MVEVLEFVVVVVVACMEEVVEEAGNIAEEDCIEGENSSGDEDEFELVVEVVVEEDMHLECVKGERDEKQ